MNQDYYNYYAVVESALDTADRTKYYSMEDPVCRPDGQLSFLRFTMCMMVVNYRNRNRRYWGKDHVDPMMKAPHIVDYFTKAGGLPGENGHPIPATGEITMERLVTIDPNNMAILLKQWWWEGDRLMGKVETLDQGEGTPGNRMMRNMLQGMVPASSARTLVPQRKNRDGSIDVLAPGRMVCFDRVNGPSCENAYMDINIPVKNIIKKAEFESAMESFTDYVMERSEAAKRVMDDILPAMESATVGKDGNLFVRAPGETRIIPLERNFRKEISSFMLNF